jgi:hypothetical protein
MMGGRGRLLSLELPPSGGFAAGRTQILGDQRNVYLTNQLPVPTRTAIPRTQSCEGVALVSLQRIEHQPA